ncbi:LysB family phage lysis regulatory protein [Candidatus Symbiopectobacterium sp. NZEC127]|uniref:Rz-like lysis system protein LysB n=1 Tax=Candidatus Symbiopectobacterium sp. NZEC127 TaxID=2820472 RepID=UPI00222703E8|nr:Rz-like lysis system protein LysB [Candidatus Symbiopectobacterium sp. NZEC127]MCW2484748.1 LysB family phage lysis regulatory protein [Candidatus Symbiopectobacterium sp. NZEC127]
MMSPWLKFMALVIACLLCIVAVNKWQLSRAERTVSQQGIALSQQKDTLLAQSAAIGTLQSNVRRNEQAQAELRIKLSQAGQLAASRDNTITRLLNENADLRRWYGTALPDDIKRLHRRPAFDGPDAYLRWLSESHELPDTGQQPANQR